MVILGCPTVECKAGNCLLILVISTTSPSTMVIWPTPALAKNSAAKDPTPPNPTTKTLAFCNFSNPSFLNNNSALSVHSAILSFFWVICLFGYLFNWVMGPKNSTEINSYQFLYFGN